MAFSDYVFIVKMVSSLLKMKLKIFLMKVLWNMNLVKGIMKKQIQMIRTPKVPKLIVNVMCCWMKMLNLVKVGLGLFLIEKHLQLSDVMNKFYFISNNLGMPIPVNQKPSTELKYFQLFHY